MTIDEIKAALKTKEYDFLRNDEHLGENIILLGLGGSHAYGTEKPDGSSDIDLRGFAFNTADEILTNTDIDWQVAGEENSGIDACIYSFMKMMKLLSECNPNCMEILGLRPEHYLYVSPVGQELLDNKDMFLSKLVIPKFLGYSSQQLYRLKQLAADGFDQSELERHILHQLERMNKHFMKDYTEFNGYLNLYIDKSSLEHFNNRDEAKAQIESLGGKVSGSVSAKTSYLVNNNPNSTSSKNVKAKKLNVPIISEQELLSMISLNSSNPSENIQSVTSKQFRKEFL